MNPANSPRPSPHQPDPATSTVTQGGINAPWEGRLPESIGKYSIKRVIAAGGMGIVYEARQENPRRAVAVKVMGHGVASRSAMRRFEFEAQVLGRLRHPGIAQIYEAGTHVDGAGTVPYFAMEYIPGAQSITQYVQEKKLGTRDRIKLFAQVCEAVHHGHQKGVIHRDLKPSNILVDASGQVKVIDFGVARGTDSDLALTTLQTDMGQLIGTLQYMSPEQCQGDPHDIDTRSDVYSLGVVFFELLTDRLPYDVREKTLHEATRLIREEPPTRLSLINRTLRGDVETIALKALEKDRTRRYQSASDFGKDLERYLVNEPISARPPSMVYRIRKFVRRRRVPLATAAAITAALGIGVNRQISASWSESLLRTRDTAYSVFMAAQPDEALNNPSKVIADCTRAIEMDPNLALAYALRAKALTMKDEYDRAYDDATKAIAIDPDFAYAHRVLAMTHLFRSDFARAKVEYEKGFQKFLLETDLPRDLHNYARARTMLGEFEEALDLQNGAVALAPKSCRVYFTRGFTRKALGQLDEALLDFDRGIQLGMGQWTLQGSLWKWELLSIRNAPGDSVKALEALAIAEKAARNPFEQDLVAICRGTSDGSIAVKSAPSTKARCSAYYSLGARAAVDDRRAVASEWFSKCIAPDCVDLPEADLAFVHLRSLH